MNKLLISIVGPTAIGKTKLAVLLAQHFDTEIISADSRQFFKEMRIGTAVPSTEELKQAKHHFVQHKTINEAYSVGDFEKEAIKKLDTLFKSNQIAIMVGGSGLYVNAVTNGLNSFPTVGKGIREKLNQDFNQNGLPSLQAKLKKLDPAYFEKVDTQNPQRIIRALEVTISSGMPYSSFINKPKPVRSFEVISIGLRAERAVLYDRINKRVDLMMDEGLLEESKLLLQHKSKNALQTVGYKELFKFHEGDWTLDFAIAEIKKNTRRFAKRQLTWFNRNESTSWFSYDYNKKNILAEVNRLISKIDND